MDSAYAVALGPRLCFNARPMILAIDGPAGAGKSTVARRVAEALGLRFLDTGAMYRAVTLVALDRNVLPTDGEACGALARELELGFDAAGAVTIDGEPGEPGVRGQTVTRNVSAVSAHGPVREAVVARQRELARAYEADGGVVAEGRDTATVVFPAADHKFFLVATDRERARRRAEQLGRPEDLELILADLERRDRLDTHRAHSPLRKAEGAHEIDSDGKTPDEVVADILAVVRRAEQERAS